MVFDPHPPLCRTGCTALPPSFRRQSSRIAAERAAHPPLTNGNSADGVVPDERGCTMVVVACAARWVTSDRLDCRNGGRVGHSAEQGAVQGRFAVVKFAEPNLLASANVSR